MTIDLTPDPHVADLAARTAAFVRAVAVPEEERLSGVASAGGEPLRHHLQQAAREAGVFAPHVSLEYGGHGLDMRGRAVVFEEAGWSLFGPLALNIAAPDEGNMHLLEAVATAEQKAKYLRPLAEGAVRSCFAMTEPAPGAGSDPAALVDRRHADGRRLAGQRPQVVHHRRRRGGVHDLHGAHVRTPGRPRRRDDVPHRRRHTGHADHASHRHARRRLLRRALRAGVRGRLRHRRSRCSATSTRASSTPRSGWLRRGSPTACAGSASPDAPRRSR